ncbi:MAG: rhodanese-like domain-containing protein [Actinomycetota bacterium]
MAFAEISVREAFQLLSSDPGSVLVDVRTPEEWNLVGIPVLDSIGKQARLATWTEYGTGLANPNFLPQALDGVPSDVPVLFLCRSGVRSKGAAAAAVEAGYTTAYNVTEGFEGDLNADGHRVTGWKHAGLPWRQG